MMRLVGESVDVDVDGSGAALQEDCRRQLVAGPPTLTAAKVESERYRISDLVDDLTGVTDPLERAAIATTLWDAALRLLLGGEGRWLGTGKGLVREVVALDGDVAPLAQAADRVLAPPRCSSAGWPPRS